MTKINKKDKKIIIEKIKSFTDFQKTTELSREEKRVFHKKGLAGVVFARLNSRKYRGSVSPNGVNEFLEENIKESIKNKKPLKLYMLFGGTKQVTVEKYFSSKADWAEVFSIALALKSAVGIASIYPYGVEVVYRGDEVVAELLMNYKKEDIKKYTESIEGIISVFQRKLEIFCQKENLKVGLRYELTSKTSPKKEVLEKMSGKYQKYELDFNKLSKEEKEKSIEKSYKKFRFKDGEKNYGNISEIEKKKIAKKAFILHNAWVPVDVSISGELFDEVVSISFRQGLAGCVQYRSSVGSRVQFWAGKGVFEIRKQKGKENNEEKNKIVDMIFSDTILESNNLKELFLGEEDGNDFAETGLKEVLVYNK